MVMRLALIFQAAVAIVAARSLWRKYLERFGNSLFDVGLQAPKSILSYAIFKSKRRIFACDMKGTRGYCAERRFIHDTWCAYQLVVVINASEFWIICWGKGQKTRCTFNERVGKPQKTSRKPQKRACITKDPPHRGLGSYVTVKVTMLH